MAGPLTILLGVLAGLGVGLAVFKTGSGSSILKKIHEIFQKQKVDEIVNIEGKQNVVRTEIATKEKTPLDLTKQISIVRMGFDYNRLPFSGTIVNKDIYLKREISFLLNILDIYSVLRNRNFLQYSE